MAIFSTLEQGSKVTLLCPALTGRHCAVGWPVVVEESEWKGFERPRKRPFRARGCAIPAS